MYINFQAQEISTIYFEYFARGESKFGGSYKRVSNSTTSSGNECLSEEFSVSLVMTETMKSCAAFACCLASSSPSLTAVAVNMEAMVTGRHSLMRSSFDNSVALDTDCNESRSLYSK